MTKPALIYRGLRFERTASSAFKDMHYAAAIEVPWPPLWKRIVQAFKEMVK